MGVANRPDIQARLQTAGWPPETPVTIGEKIGYDDEQSIHSRIHELDGLSLETPAVILVGIAPARQTVRTLFTGTNPDHFLVQGPLLHWPMIHLQPEPVSRRTELLAEHLDKAAGVLFPSRFAVACLVEALMDTGDIRILVGKKLLAVGPATERALSETGLKADLAAASLGGVRDLAARLRNDLRGRYLYPCSDAAPVSRRIAFLGNHGVELQPAVFYRNQPTPVRPLPRLPFHRVLFTSASTVQQYFSRYPTELASDRAWLAVGPSTLEALQQWRVAGELLGG
jgi:uroporphyrinogen III methyltransferase/synthase